MAKAYEVYYQKAGTGPNYTMDHSTALYLMDPQGQFHGVIADGLTPRAGRAADLRGDERRVGRRTGRSSCALDSWTSFTIVTDIVAAHNRRGPMLYSLHEAAYNSATPIRLAARAARDFWGSPLNPASATRSGAARSTPRPTWSPTSPAATAARPGASTT